MRLEKLNRKTIAPAERAARRAAEQPGYVVDANAAILHPACHNTRILSHAFHFEYIPGYVDGIAEQTGVFVIVAVIVGVIIIVIRFLVALLSKAWSPCLHDYSAA